MVCGRPLSAMQLEPECDAERPEGPVAAAVQARRATAGSLGAGLKRGRPRMNVVWGWSRLRVDSRKPTPIPSARL